MNGMVSIFTSAEFQDEKRPLPRSSVLVCRLMWSWGPAHSRTDMYSISGRFRHWTLWATAPDFDTGKPMNGIYASGRWEKSISKHDAARQLLMAAWSNEWSLYMSPGKDFSCCNCGLLSEDEIREIAEIAFDESET